MNRSKGMRQKAGFYSIGQASRIVDLPAHILRYLEERSLVHPKRDKKNGYRYYTVDEIKTLIEYRWYRDAGFSVSESVDIIKHTDLFQIGPKLQESQCRMAEEIRKKELLIERLRSYGAKLSMEYLLEHVHVFDTTVSPEMHFCSYASLCDGRYSYKTADALVEWFDSLEEFTFTFFDYIFVLPQNASAGADAPQEITWGFAIEKAWAEALGADKLLDFPCLPASQCIHTFLRFDKSDNVYDVIKRDILPTLEMHGFTPSGSIWGNQLAYITENDREIQYVEIWIPVGKTPGFRLNSRLKPASK